MNNILANLDTAKEETEGTLRLIQELKKTIASVISDNDRMTNIDLRQYEEETALLQLAAKKVDANLQPPPPSLYSIPARKRQNNNDMIRTVPKKIDQTKAPTTHHRKKPEERLPKVLVCAPGANVPKYIICNKIVKPNKHSNYDELFTFKPTKEVIQSSPKIIEQNSTHSLQPIPQNINTNYIVPRSVNKNHGDQTTRMELLECTETMILKRRIELQKQIIYLEAEIKQLSLKNIDLHEKIVEAEKNYLQSESVTIMNMPDEQQKVNYHSHLQEYTNREKTQHFEESFKISNSPHVKPKQKFVIHRQESPNKENGTDVRNDKPVVYWKKQINSLNEKHAYSPSAAIEKRLVLCTNNQKSALERQVDVMEETVVRMHNQVLSARTDRLKIEEQIKAMNDITSGIPYYSVAGQQNKEISKLFKK